MYANFNNVYDCNYLEMETVRVERSLQILECQDEVDRLVDKAQMIQIQTTLWRWMMLGGILIKTMIVTLEGEYA